MMKKKISLFVIVIVITLFAGCTTQVTTSSPQDTSTPVVSSLDTDVPTASPVSTLDAAEILAPVIAAMRQTTSVKVDTNILEHYGIQGPSEDVYTTYIWDGQRAVDITNDRMRLMMNIDIFSGGLYIGTRTNVYYDGETTYGQYWMSGVISPQGNWIKSELIEELAYSTAKDQVTPVIGLLESARYVTYKTEGKLDGPDYHVISFSPSAEAAADWVLSQRYAGGPSFLTAAGITIVGKTAFTKAYQGGTFIIWVNSLNNLVMKAYFCPVFRATRAELDELYGYPPSGKSGNYERNFTAQLNFTAYNQPLDVQPPPEALNAAGN